MMLREIRTRVESWSRSFSTWKLLTFSLSALASLWDHERAFRLADERSQRSVVPRHETCHWRKRHC